MSGWLFSLSFVFRQLRKIYRKDSWVLKQSLATLPLKKASYMRNWQTKLLFGFRVITLKTVIKNITEFWKALWRQVTSTCICGLMRDLYDTFSTDNRPYICSGNRQVSLCVSQHKADLFFIWSVGLDFSLSILALKNKDTGVPVNTVSAGNRDSEALGAALQFRVVLETGERRFQAVHEYNTFGLRINGYLLRLHLEFQGLL